jgi:hypothetical protein
MMSVGSLRDEGGNQEFINAQVSVLEDLKSNGV